MTPTETQGLLAWFAAAFTNHELPDNTPKVWATELADVNPEDARTAMHLLVKTETFHPSIARFRETCASMARRRHMANADTRGIEASTEEELPMSESVGRARALRAGLHAVKDDAA